jgi:hypothetical protein
LPFISDVYLDEKVIKIKKEIFLKEIFGFLFQKKFFYLI